MQEQEPSVNDILSSIRQILSNKMEEENAKTVSSNEIKQSVVQEVVGAEQSLKPETDVYILTPSMRVVQGNEVYSSVPSNDGVSSNDVLYEPSEIVETQKVTEKIEVVEPQLQMQKNEETTMPALCETDLRPMIQDWLDKNLPTLVERIVAEEVRRIFNKR